MEWEEVAEHLKTNFKGEVDDAGCVTITWHLHRDRRAGPARVRVGPVGLFDIPSILCVADLFDQGVLDPRVALNVNAALPVGKLALHGESYVIQAVFSLAHTSLDELDRCIEHMTREAMRLRLHVVPPPWTNVFEHFAN